MSERERGERDRQRDRERQIERDRQTDRQRDRDRDRQTDRDRERQPETLSSTGYHDHFSALYFIDCLRLLNRRVPFRKSFREMPSSRFCYDSLFV